MATLLLISGPLEGNRVEVKRTMVIGRDNADIVLDDPEVSRRHASVQPAEQNGLQFTDLGSLNGTWVNGNRIEGTLVVWPGDVVKIGKSFFELEGRSDSPTIVSRPTSTAEKLASAEEEHPREQRTRVPDKPVSDSAGAPRPAAVAPLAASASAEPNGPPESTFAVTGGETRRSRRRVASRQQVPMVLAFSVIIITGVVLVLYFFVKFMG